MQDANGTVLPFPVDYGYVSAVLVQKMNHDHPKFEENSSTLYDEIDEYFTGNSHASVLKSFKKTKDGFRLW